MRSSPLRYKNSTPPWGFFQSLCLTGLFQAMRHQAQCYPRRSFGVLEAASINSTHIWEDFKTLDDTTSFIGRFSYLEQGVQVNAAFAN